MKPRYATISKLQSNRSTSHHHYVKVKICLYSCFYREPEPQILDYVTQQHKLIIAIATTHAYHFTVRWLWDLYVKVNKELGRGQLDNLPEVRLSKSLLSLF